MGENAHSLEEVLAGDFEARCVGRDGMRFLWCQRSGLRVDPQSNETTLLSDAAGLPDGPWLVTDFGLRQLAEDGGDGTAACPSPRRMKRLGNAGCA